MIVTCSKCDKHHAWSLVTYEGSSLPHKVCTPQCDCAAPMTVVPDVSGTSNRVFVAGGTEATQEDKSDTIRTFMGKEWSHSGPVFRITMSDTLSARMYVDHNYLWHWFVESPDDDTNDGEVYAEGRCSSVMNAFEETENYMLSWLKHEELKRDEVLIEYVTQGFLPRQHMGLEWKHNERIARLELVAGNLYGFVLYKGNNRWQWGLNTQWDNPEGSTLAEAVCAVEDAITKTSKYRETKMQWAAEAKQDISHQLPFSRSFRGAEWEKQDNAYQLSVKHREAIHLIHVKYEDEEKDENGYLIVRGGWLVWEMRDTNPERIGRFDSAAEALAEAESVIDDRIETNDMYLAGVEASEKAFNASAFSSGGTKQEFLHYDQRIEDKVLQAATLPRFMLRDVKISKTKKTHHTGCECRSCQVDACIRSLIPEASITLKARHLIHAVNKADLPLPTEIDVVCNKRGHQVVTLTWGSDLRIFEVSGHTTRSDAWIGDALGTIASFTKEQHPAPADKPPGETKWVCGAIQKPVK